MEFCRASLILDREGSLAAALGTMDFDDIGISGQPEATGNYRKCAEHTQRPARCGFSRLHARMEQPAFYRELVLRPLTIEMDQRALPRTEDKVLERRDGQKVVFAFHGKEAHAARTSSVTPDGSPSRSTVTS